MRLAGLLVVLTMSSSMGCGSKERKCDPFQSPGMTRADVDKQAAASGAKPTEEQCAGLDVVRVKNGDRSQAWYLKEGLVVGYTRDDAGLEGCSGDVPPTCK